MPGKLFQFFKKPFLFTISDIKFNLLYGLLTLILYNGVFFKHAADFRSDILFMSGLFVSLWLILFAACGILFHGRLRKPLAITLVISNALAFYFMFLYNAALDKIMFLNVLRTDAAEVKDLLNPRFFLIFIGMGLLPAWLIAKTHINSSSLKQQIMSVVSALFLASLIILSNFSTTRQFLDSNRNLRYYLAPSGYIGSIISVIKIKAKPRPELIKIGEDAHTQKYWKNDKKNLIIFVVGETARAANFSLRGYHRPTNEPLTPYLKDIIYYSDTTACGTSTAVAVPCLFSKDSRTNFKTGSEVYTENLLDVMEKGGYKVLWRENNTGCQNVCDRVELEDPCTTGKFCLDEVMLQNFDARMQEFGKNAMIVLHQRGSHGPAYSEHYPKAAERYTPICEQKDFPSCSQESLINVYDNSIYYTSMFLAQTIEELQKLSDKYNTVMIYISDHGESLGENGMFLHAAPYDTAPKEQIDIPFLVWISDSFAHDFGIDKACLQKQARKPHSQDNIFHSLLGLSGIKTSVYDKKLDIFANCRK